MLWMIKWLIWTNYCLCPNKSVALFEFLNLTNYALSNKLTHCLNWLKWISCCIWTIELLKNNNNALISFKWIGLCIRIIKQEWGFDSFEETHLYWPKWISCNSTVYVKALNDELTLLNNLVLITPNESLLFFDSELLINLNKPGWVCLDESIVVFGFWIGKNIKWHKSGSRLYFLKWTLWSL